MAHYEFTSNDTVGAHIRCHKSAEPKVGTPALLTIKGEEVPLTVRFCQDIKRTDKDAPREVSVWLFVIKKSGDGKILTKHRGEKATLDIGTVAANKAVEKRMEELRPKPKAEKKVSAPLAALRKAVSKGEPIVEVPAYAKKFKAAEESVTTEQKKAKKAKTKAKHEAVAQR